jgi:hypothetical protein
MIGHDGSVIIVAGFELIRITSILLHGWNELIVILHNQIHMLDHNGA